MFVLYCFTTDPTALGDWLCTSWGCGWIECRCRRWRDADRCAPSVDESRTKRPRWNCGQSRWNARCRYTGRQIKKKIIEITGTKKRNKSKKKKNSNHFKLLNAFLKKTKTKNNLTNVRYPCSFILHWWSHKMDDFTRAVTRFVFDNQLEIKSVIIGSGMLTWRPIRCGAAVTHLARCLTRRRAETFWTV